MSKIIFEPDYWRRPANGLVKAIQERLKEILHRPKEFGVKDAFTLKSVIEHEAEILAQHYKRCSLRDLQFKVHQLQGYLQGYDDHFFEIEHRTDNIAQTARCVFDMGGKQFHPEFNQPMPGLFGRIVIEL